jgi:hypothetical protein
MRLWSIHPKYLDAQGLVALWRETLLAQKVLAGKTKGYKHHPQLIRFRNTKVPMAAIGTYLHHIEIEAQARNYHFDRSKILKISPRIIIKVTSEQIQYESKHLLNKLSVRSPEVLQKWINHKKILPHPIFKIVLGEIENWEIQ